ncbi:MAG: FAD-dependent oxidoreductase [Nitrospirae bacterium]|nr:FAD-dependent oxidoreductase [Nitrospirota bacterium]
MSKLVIEGKQDGHRVTSRALEELIQKAVKDGAREIRVVADGQHGIGGRIWPRGEVVRFDVEGPVGQRLGSMGMFGTEIVINGSVSDDVGWLNCGANITVLGNVTNGAHNAAAQGRLYVQGGGGARCDTMTKHNPKFPPPESWYFRDVGDTFAEFKAGGIAVVCAVNPRNAKNVLGYRPCVGMVGGVIYFRGNTDTYSQNDVRLLQLTDADWAWLTERMKPYLESIERMDYFGELTRAKEDWKKLVPFTAQERSRRKPFKVSIADFRRDYWEKGVGKGGIFAEYLTHPLTILPYVTNGEDRRFKPVWNNQKYAPPCQSYCPSDIPTQKRTALIRADKLHEALELILEYSPLPATVCGEICPNLCMDACTRARVDKPLNIKGLGKASLEVKAPKRLPATGRKIAVVGGGPGGLSAAWQLALKGHEVNLYEAEDKLGGKLELCIPRERLPQEVLTYEIDRFKSIGINAVLGTRVDSGKFREIYDGHDVVIVSCGAHKARRLPVPGAEDMLNGYDFLRNINLGSRPDFSGKRVAIVGAGNVAMDVAAQAFSCGANGVTAVDVQKPAASGKELEIAKSLGTEILWPKFTEKYSVSDGRIYFTDGTSLEADVVIVSIGDMPVTDFLPPSVHTDKNGWVEADEVGHTSDAKVYAVGDATKLGLVTHAIGHGKRCADAVNALLSGISYYRPPGRLPIPYEKIKDAFYEVCQDEPFMPQKEAHRCMSCAVCRDCHMCEVTCYYGAITRKSISGGNGAEESYEYVVDPARCIGCGFCAGVCPCGIWDMVDNI